MENILILMLRNLYGIFSVSDICPGVTFDFPNAIQVTDQAQYRSYFPALIEGTICFWFNMATNHNQRFVVLFSYAVASSDNEILFGIDEAFSLEYYLKGPVRATFDLPRVPEHQVNLSTFRSVLFCTSCQKKDPKIVITKFGNMRLNAKF